MAATAPEGSNDVVGRPADPREPVELLLWQLRTALDGLSSPWSRTARGRRRDPRPERVVLVLPGAAGERAVEATRRSRPVSAGTGGGRLWTRPRSSPETFFSSRRESGSLRTRACSKGHQLHWRHRVRTRVRDRDADRAGTDRRSHRAGGGRAEPARAAGEARCLADRPRRRRRRARVPADRLARR